MRGFTIKTCPPIFVLLTIITIFEQSMCERQTSQVSIVLHGERIEEDIPSWNPYSKTDIPDLITGEVVAVYIVSRNIKKWRELGQFWYSVINVNYNFPHDESQTFGTVAPSDKLCPWFFQSDVAYQSFQAWCYWKMVAIRIHCKR